MSLGAALRVLACLSVTACGGGGGAAVAPPPPSATLTVSTTPGGSVQSAPAGVDCGATCSASYQVGTSVTLTAQATGDFQFNGWTGECQGTSQTCVVTLDSSKSANAKFVPIQPVQGAPFVQYTDALSGPTSGGEGGLGTYLSIFGTGFGSPAGLGTSTKVTIGGVEVANYRYLGPSKVGGKLGLQQITVQVGNLGLPQGQPAAIQVVVASAPSNTNNTFTPNPGQIFFVSLDGDDKTGVRGDINHPYRHLQTPDSGGIAPLIGAGDHIVIRGGTWSDIGFDSSWFRFRYPNTQGSKPTGKGGTGWIHFTAYPGPIGANAVEDVHYVTPANMKGGFQGANSAYLGTTGDYVSVSNLHLEVDANAQSDAAPINLQYSGGPWRVVNNELGPWPSAIHARSGGVSGHGDGTFVLGNHIHDINCVDAQENHGIYADSGASNWNIGFNWVHDITGGNLIQFFDNVGLMGHNYVGFPKDWPGFVGMNIYNNWLENASKYGLNMADSIVSGNIWNNVVVGAKLSGLRLNTISKNMDFTIAFNTFYDNDQLSQYAVSQIVNTWGNYGPTGTIRVYDNIVAGGPHSAKNSSFYANTGDSDAYMDFKRNLYWDAGNHWGKFARDPQALLGDPMFKAPLSGDLSLTPGSPAIDQGTQAISWTVPYDMTGFVGRPQGAANDLGAYELGAN